MQPVVFRLRRRRATLAVVFVLACAGSAGGAAQTAAQVEADAIAAAIVAAGAEWTAGVTSIAQLSAAERLARCGTILRVPTSEERISIPVGWTPTAFDWRQKGGTDWTSPIRDQDGCGSCWDFSAIGVFEALLNIASGSPALDQDLSEQYVLSCCPSCGNCPNGGFPSAALEFCRTTGTVTETCLPYWADDTVPCGNACSGETLVRINNWNYLPADVEQIKQAIYDYGPVCACFVVYTDFFYYTSGVYEHVSGEVEGGHAIVIVGWDDASQSWICKNSWGTNWGETVDGQPYTWGADDGGWFRIRWGNCDIESYETVMATLTSPEPIQVTVAVLDQSGVGIVGVDVYVNCGEWYDVTGTDGMVTFDLPASYGYDIVACSEPEHLLLYGRVTSSGTLTLDCRTASQIAVTAKRVDGSPLEANLVFECGGSEIMWPVRTAGGTGSFWVTPGVYDFHVWRWPSAGEEGYNLAMLHVDFGASGALLIDTSAMPTARVSLDALPDFTAFLHLGLYSDGGFHWYPVFDLTQGDAIYTEGSWDIIYKLTKDMSSTVTWIYSYSDSVWLAADSDDPISAGGTLGLSALPDRGSYTRSETALIYTVLQDRYGNSFDQVVENDGSGSPPSSPARGPAVRKDENPPGHSATYYDPWLTVTPPTSPAVFDGQTCLGVDCAAEVEFSPDAELGTYALHATQETHQGTLVADSSFDVIIPTPDPYEPNDACETAYSIGALPPSFSSETAHGVDPNEDWFSFQVAGTGLLVIESTCTGSDADTVIWLYAGCGGALLAYDDDSGPGLGSHIECAVAPGTYKLLIDQFGADYGAGTEYSFTVELRPIPDIAVSGAEPIVLQVPEGAVKDFPGLLSVGNEGDPGSALDFRTVEQEAPPSSPLAPEATGTAAKRPPFGITEPAKVLPPKVGEPGSEWTFLLVDPKEPAAGPGDIAQVYAQIHDGVLYFRVVSHKTWGETYTGLGAFLWLDIDQDSGTGFGSDDGWYMDEIGADYCICVGNGYADLYEWQSGDWKYVDEAVYLSLSPNANEFTVGVPMEDLAIPSLPPGASPGLDLICCNWQDYVDWAPDEGLGHITYPPSVSYLSTVPAEGAVSGGGTSAVTLHVDARGLYAGATRRARLYFMSNDPDELPTRDVVINVVGGTGTPAVFSVDPAGVVRTDSSFYGSSLASGSADIAEWVTVSEPVAAGDVLELDPRNPGHYRRTVGPCSSLVAGVVSTQPALSLGGVGAEGQALLALAGMVPVKACDESGPIALGDLVVPSSIPGYVMRWDEQRFPTCTPVGKALQELDGGIGAILILLMR